MKKSQKHKKHVKKFVYRLFYAIIFLIILKYLSGYFYKRYYTFLPTIRVYPSNENELIIIKKEYIEKRTKEDIDFFYLTDPSVVYAFKNVVSETIDDMMNIVFSPHLLIIILGLKIFINRPRPQQIDNNLDILRSTTANTGAFPSGHTTQAYYLAKKLSQRYPDKKKLLFEIAEKCGNARIYAGLHYPSDHNFGKYIALNLL